MNNNNNNNNNNNKKIDIYIDQLKQVNKKVHK